MEAFQEEYTPAAAARRMLKTTKEAGKLFEGKLASTRMPGLPKKSDERVAKVGW